MRNRWLVLPQPESEKVEWLSQQLGFPKEIASLLIQRGVDTFDKTKVFFKPDLKENLHNPFLMKDMDKAVKRVAQAIENEENILIYGDYDVDGTTSVAMMYLFITSIYNKNNIDYYTPDRYEEGYGISYQVIDFAVENNFSLIIALDCGIKEVEKIEYASLHSIDFIICDHHLAGDKVPQAVAVLDPEQPGCQYPYKYLSGCGVGFKLIQALAQEFKIPDEQIFLYLDLVSVSIAADIVPITGENRILSMFGLKQLNTCPRTGLKVFISEEMKGHYSIESIVFGIAPKINAAGRMKHANNAVRLLISNNEAEARKIYSQVTELNTERRELDSDITHQAMERIKTSGQENSYSTVIYNRNWHKGVIGIVASRLAETYYRPTLVFTKGKNESLVASGRSVRGFDLYKALEASSDYIDQFGGHMYAAGLTIKKENFLLFKEKFESVVKNMIRESQRTPTIEIDEEISLDIIDHRFFRLIRYFMPFGPENMSPVFLARNINYAGNHLVMGKSKNHLKFTVFQNDIRKTFEALMFNANSKIISRLQRSVFDLVFSLEENYWQDKIFYQLKIRDIKFHEA